MLIIAIIVALSASPIGWSVQKKPVDSVKLNDVLKVLDQGQPDYGGGPGIAVYTVTVTSTFMPRQYGLPQTQACLYNTVNKTGVDLSVQWDVQLQSSALGIDTNYLEVFQGSKSATLNAMAIARYKPEQAAGKPQPVFVVESYDQLLLFFNEDFRYSYRQCNMLQPADIEQAVKIRVEN